MVRGVPAHVTSFVVTFCLVPDLSVGTTVDQVVELNAVGLSGPQSIRGQVAALSHQRQGDYRYHNGHHRQNNVHND